MEGGRKEMRREGGRKEVGGKEARGESEGRKEGESVKEVSFPYSAMVAATPNHLCLS